MLIVIGLYAVLWGKYKEYKEKEAEEILESVKDVNANKTMMMIRDIEANNGDVMHKKENKTRLPLTTLAFSAPISTPPMLAAELPKP